MIVCKKKSILIILEATLGGTRKHILDLIFGLDKSTYDIYFFYSDFRADDLFLQNLLPLNNHCKVLKKIPMTSNVASIFNVYCCIQISKLLLTKSIDILHLHGAIGGGVGRIAVFLCRFKGLVVYTPHGGVFHRFDGVKGSIYKRLENILSKVTKYYIAVSFSQKEEICKEIIVNENRVKVIHNGIDIKYDDNLTIGLIPDEIKKVIEGKFVVLYPALFLPAKGHLEFFTAINNNSNFKFNDDIVILLAGDGQLINIVKQIVNANKLIRDQIFFLGFVVNLKDYFKICNLVILPSNSEAFGYVLLEAFLYKKAVFCTSVGGIIDIVRNKENGLLFETNQLIDLAKAINYYSVKKNLLNEMGTRGFEDIVKHFSLECMLKKHIEIFNFK